MVGVVWGYRCTDDKWVNEGVGCGGIDVQMTRGSVKGRGRLCGLPLRAGVEDSGGV